MSPASSTPSLLIQAATSAAASCPSSLFPSLSLKICSQHHSHFGSWWSSDPNPPSIALLLPNNVKVIPRPRSPFPMSLKVPENSY